MDWRSRMAGTDTADDGETVVRYTLAGVGLGTCFPLLATLILALREPGNQSFIQFIGWHQSNPLLWVIDSAPLVLGCLFYFLGVRARQLGQLAEAIRQMNIALIHDFSRLSEQMGCGLLLADADGKILFANARVEALLGEPERPLLHRRIDEFVVKIGHGSYSGGAYSGLLAALQASAAQSGVHRLDEVKWLTSRSQVLQCPALMMRCACSDSPLWFLAIGELHEPAKIQNS